MSFLIILLRQISSGREWCGFLKGKSSQLNINARSWPRREKKTCECSDEKQKNKKNKNTQYLDRSDKGWWFFQPSKIEENQVFCPWFNQYLTTENMFIKLTWEKVLENYPFSQGASSCLQWTSEVLHLHFSSWMLEPNFILSFPKLWRTNNRPVVQIIPISIFTKCTHFLVMRNWWLKVMTVKIAFSGQVL